MALPPDTSEPESPEEEEEIIDAGFDALVFWDRYRQFILLAGGLLLLGLVAFGIYEYKHEQRIAAAGAALAAAATDDDFRQVIDQFQGTIAAGDASLFLAGRLRDEKKYDDALQVLQDFLDKYPTHPLAHAGDLSYAETLEDQGKLDDAVARYEEVAAKYPDSYSAPISVIAEANLLRTQGKTEEARRLYENFVAQFPDSIFSQEAMAEMHLLRAPTSSAASASPGPETNSLNLPALTIPAPTASPSPAAAAPSASAPVVPTLPGASPQ